MQEIYEQLSLNLCQEPMYGAQDSLVRMSALQGNSEDSLEVEVDSLMKLLGSSKAKKEEDKPTWLFLENVRNLLSINGGWDFARVLTAMDEIGYDAEWALINSADVVPQNRERIFIVGHLRGRSRRKVFPITNGSGETISKSAEIKQIGNVMPTKTRANPNQGRVYDITGIAPSLNCCGGGGREPKVLVEGNVNPSGKGMNGQVYNINGLSPTLTTNKGEGNKIYDGMVIRRLTPCECSRLQGWTDDYFKKAQAVNSDSQLYKQYGNGVTVPVVCEIAKRLCK